MSNVKALFITAFTAASLALAAPQTAHAGGVYVNGHGGGAVVVNGGGRYYGPGGYYQAPAYYEPGLLRPWRLRSLLTQPPVESIQGIHFV